MTDLPRRQLSTLILSSTPPQHLTGNLKIETNPRAQ